MNWPTVSVIFVLAVSSVGAQSQRPSLESLKGREITFRACVEQALFNAVQLSHLTAVNASSAPIPATRVLYWFYKPAEFKDRMGQNVEISASIREATEGERELTVHDGIVAEIEPAAAPVSVATAGSAAAEKPTALSGDVAPVETVTLKLDVSNVKLLSTGCNSTR